MIIKMLSDHQFSELEYYMLVHEIKKIGIVIETGDLIIEYENNTPYPTRKIETIKIPIKNT